MTMAMSFKGAHFPRDILLIGVRWYVAYPLSYWHVEEHMQERGVPVDHATLRGCDCAYQYGRWPRSGP